MRSYNKFRSTFWGSGATGRALRDYPEATRLLAIYLFTCDRAMAEPWGLYYSPRASIGDALNMTPAKVNAGLATLGELDFARFDVRTEWVWVVNMAAEQVLTDGRPLKPTDNMSAAANRWYVRCPRNPYLGPFFDRYVAYLHLDERRDGGIPETLGPPRLSAGEVQGTLVDVPGPGLLTGPDAPLVPLGKAVSVADKRVAEFDQFWAAYHAKGKSSKAKAKEMWMRLKPRAPEVMAGLERWHASQRWNDGYVVDAARFLKEERYLEHPPAAPLPGLSERTRDVVEALDTGRSIFDLDDAPAAAPKRLRGAGG